MNLLSKLLHIILLTLIYAYSANTAFAFSTSDSCQSKSVYDSLEGLNGSYRNQDGKLVKIDLINKTIDFELKKTHIKECSAFGETLKFILGSQVKSESGYVLTLYLDKYRDVNPENIPNFYRDALKIPPKYPLGYKIEQGGRYQISPGGVVTIAALAVDLSEEGKLNHFALLDPIPNSTQNTKKADVVIVTDSSQPLPNGTLTSDLNYNKKNGQMKYKVNGATKKDVSLKKASRSNNNKWKLEPSSFMQIQLGKPLILSATKVCPSGMGPDVAQEYIKIVREQGLLCYNEALTGKIGTYNNAFSIWEHHVDIFDKRLLVKTYEDKPESIVGAVEVLFPSQNYSMVKEMLMAKYGVAHSEKIDKVKTNGGAEFDNEISIWSGEKTTIKIQSLLKRDFSEGSIREFGSVLVNSTDYLKHNSQKASDVAKKYVDEI